MNFVLFICNVEFFNTSVQLGCDVTQCVSQHLQVKTYNTGGFKLSMVLEIYEIARESGGVRQLYVQLNTFD